MKTKLGMLAVLAAISAPAAADTIDLGVASNYNVFVFDNYQTSQWGWSTIGGAVAVGGNANLTSSGIANSNGNDYAVVVGGNLTKTYNGITGVTWVGGTVNAPQWDSYNNYSSGAAPIDFAAAKSSLSALSSSLYGTTATGSVEYKYGTGGYLTGTNSAIEYFTLSSSDLGSINNWNFSSIASGATLILNISGDYAALTGGWNTFGDYNVLLNFYDATTVNLGGINLSASILATNATITGGSGTVNGTVVANNWNNALTLGANNGFVAITTAVPEPHHYALLLAGLTVILVTAKRRRKMLTAKV